MPDPRMSANQIDMRFQSVENILHRCEVAIGNLSGQLGKLQTETLAVMLTRIEELEEAMDEL